MASSGGDGTVISVSFPDGNIIGFDRLRSELIINGNSCNMRMPHRNMPARPSAASVRGGAAMGGKPGAMAAPAPVMVEEPPAEPVEKRGMMTKLGWKKTMLGGDSWQQRYFVLTPTAISYAKDPSGAAIDTIALNNGVIVNVVHARSPARKNR